MKYTDSLHVGDTAYVWCGDVRRPVKVLKVDKRTITTTPIDATRHDATFGRRSGKSCGNTTSGYHLANAVGENEID